MHDRLEAGGGLRIGIGRAPVLGDAERLERAEEIGFSSPDISPMNRPKRSLASKVLRVRALHQAVSGQLSRKRWSCEDSVDITDR